MDVTSEDEVHLLQNSSEHDHQELMLRQGSFPDIRMDSHTPPANDLIPTGMIVSIDEKDDLMYQKRIDDQDEDIKVEMFFPSTPPPMEGYCFSPKAFFRNLLLFFGPAQMVAFGYVDRMLLVLLFRFHESFIDANWLFILFSSLSSSWSSW